MALEKNSIKKELSCKSLIPIFNAVKEKKLNINKIIEGIPYDLNYLSNKHERIEWSYWCRIISNSRAFFKPSDYEEMGRNYVKSGSYIEAVLASYILFSSNNSSRILSKHFFRMNKKDFNCIRYYMEFPDSNKRKVTVYLEDSYEFYPEFIYISKGVAEQIAAQMKHKEFKIETTWVHQGAVFDISWKKEDVFFDFKKWIMWLFNFKKAFLYLADSHEELINQYNKLDESKRLLQKQTTQLKTAYEITKSIKQSLDIKKTLNAITNALVNDAGFSSAYIKLFKDVEGINFETEAFRGKNEKNVKSINQSIVINDEKIGELITQPKIGTDTSECEELLNYLLPIINISIHDSLVLRTVTDYKNNLENKVADRTNELKKARDKLSGANHLLQDAQQAQNRFFTNISHEFRTPLTLILGPVQQILRDTKNPKIKEDANIIHRNAKKLNRLANQLLDISSIEAGKMKLKAGKQNLIPVIKEIVSSFQVYAERKNISLEFNSVREEIILYLDKDKIDKILSNILSNALKFTPNGGSVNVEVEFKTPTQKPIENNELKENKISISVTDTGIGIPPEQLCKIFDRFFQVDNKLSKEYEGTGVGLSLTKELVELHKGEISVESEEGKGTTFRIMLPLGKEHLLPEEIVHEAHQKENKGIEQFVDSIIIQEINGTRKENGLIEKSDKPLLLIVEDNPDVRKYIAGILEDYYRITESSNGEEGLCKSFDEIPDLIISDIMMPKLDGIQLCAKLKSDKRTSHVPLILLTAKATLKDKIEGLETGADDYIMKPFEASELKARIKNLLEQRKRIHEYFQSHGLFEIEEKQVTQVDKEFLRKAVEIINENIDNPGFSVEFFADNLAVSRSLLHKKLIALVGESPGELVKRIRLNKAAKLIENKSGNVTDIAFEVGFNDPSYFTACFKKQFGVSPSHYNKATN